MQMTSRFRWPFASEEDAAYALEQFYLARLKARGVSEMTNKDEVIRHIRSIAKWATSSSKVGLLMCGGVGSGKTTMLWALCRMLSLASGMNNREYSFCWTDANNLAMLYSTESTDYATYRNCRWLGIDDLGQEPLEVVSYGNVRYPLRDILLHRYDYNLITIITTNLTPKAISEKYGERIGDRLREMMQIELFTEKSYR